MKIAARFPIKESKGLRLLVVFLHLAVLLLSFLMFGVSLAYLLVFISLLLSYYYSLKQLNQITQAPDDLCWTGEKWMIRIKNVNNKLDYQEAVYLDILPSSWITNGFSLLKFKDESFGRANIEYVWFFNSSNLGDRLYRELCYLCKQALKEQSRIESD